jgi:hypothetical protein
MAFAYGFGSKNKASEHVVKDSGFWFQGSGGAPAVFI